MSSAYKITMADATVIANGELITLRAATAWTSRGSLLEVVRMSVGQTGSVTSAQLAVRWGLKAVEEIQGSLAFATWDEAELMEVSMTSARGAADPELLGVSPQRMAAVLGG